MNTSKPDAVADNSVGIHKTESYRKMGPRFEKTKPRQNVRSE
jgi:hypothetical protein